MSLDRALLDRLCTVEPEKFTAERDALARELKKDRVQIHRWMRRFGLDPADFRG